MEAKGAKSEPKGHPERPKMEAKTSQGILKWPFANKYGNSEIFWSFFGPILEPFWEQDRANMWWKIDAKIGAKKASKNYAKMALKKQHMQQQSEFVGNMILPLRLHA